MGRYLLRESLEKGSATGYTASFANPDRALRPDSGGNGFMLNTLRKGAQGLAAKILLGLLALSFGVWGVGDYVNRQQNAPVAVVDGDPVSMGEFANVYEDNLNRLRSLMGAQFDRQAAKALGLRESSLELLIDRRLIVSTAAELRVTVPQNILNQAIVGNQEFHDKGQFSQQRYEAVLGNMRLSAKEYLNRLRFDYTAGQLERAVRGDGSTLPAAQVDAGYDLEFQKRRASVLTLDPAKLEAAVVVDDAAMETWLKENQQRFMSPLAVTVDYVALTPDTVKGGIQISDEAIATAYAESSANYRSQEQVHARHILIKSDGSSSQDDAALQRITGLHQRITAGELDFAQAAREYSEDSSAAAGGDLGYFARGIMVPAFEMMAFNLEALEISEPVKSPFGYHLIQLLERRGGETRPLDAVREEIRAQLQADKAVDAVYAASTQVEDQLYAGGDLATLAKDMGLILVEGVRLVQEGSTPQGLTGDDKFRSTAFATAVGELSPLVETQGTQFFALRVKTREEPRPLTLAEAREGVEHGYRAHMARQEAEKILTGLLKELREGTPWEQMAGRHPALVAQTFAPFTRQGDGVTLSAPLVAEAFSIVAPGGISAQVTSAPEGVGLVRLEEILPPDARMREKQRDNYRDMLARDVASELYAAFMNARRRQARIEINPEILDRF
ncbi:MAG: SurA N-terminal domain-containing protein [Magnetococcus sp. WYHC-3]